MSYVDSGKKTINEKLTASFILSVYCGFSISLVMFYANEFYTPRKKLKALSHPSLEHLKTMGFKIAKSLDYIEANYKGHEIQVEWSPNSPFSKKEAILIFLHCDLAQIDIEQFNEKYNPKKMLAVDNGILSVEEMFRSIPKAETLENRLNNLVQIADGINKSE